MEESLPMFVARRQKRIMYLQTQFTENCVDLETAAELQGLLKSYQGLLAKLVRTTAPEEQEALKLELQNSDRKLTRAFEERRLATSPKNQDGTSATLVMKPRNVE